MSLCCSSMFVNNIHININKNEKINRLNFAKKSLT